jgi:YD repeat-containing protein
LVFGRFVGSLAILLLFCAHPASAQGVTYTHDSAGRLATANYGAAGTVTYTYTAAGHLIARSLPAPILGIAKTHSGNFTAGQSGAT